MKLGANSGVDEGYDLNVGDTVFIKFGVVEPPDRCGDVKLQFFPRNGKDEYGARRINSVFIKRPS